MQGSIYDATRRQSAEQTEYAAINLLFRLEEGLKNYNAWIAVKFSKLIKSKEDSVLDFGCGTGILMRLVSHESGALPVGVEMDPSLRKHCVSSGQEVKSSIKEFNKNFGLVFSSNVLEHIENDLGALKEIRAGLTQGGCLALFLPAFPILWTSMDARVGHYRRYTRNSVEEVLRNAGFYIEYSRYCDSIGFLMSLLYKILPNSDGEPSMNSLKFYDRLIFPVSKLLDKLLGRFIGKNVFVVARANHPVDQEFLGADLALQAAPRSAS